MPRLRKELALVLERLLRESASSGRLSLDAVGEAVGALAVSTDEIDALLVALEAEGREVVAPEGKAELHLKRVVLAARSLKTRLARRPTLAEVAAEAEISAEQALVALALLRVMQR
jgi:hypothetical protein